VQTPLGRGVVRELRNHGRVSVAIGDRTLVLEEATLKPVDLRSSRKSKRAIPPAPNPVSSSGPSIGTTAEIDLHGLTVEEALGRVDDALNRALLGDVFELRIIHGRSGGRLRSAVHRRLAEIPSVRTFHLDARNPGVTVVRF
jgi:DNA mismatch repair protein MutS2